MKIERDDAMYKCAVLAISAPYFYHRDLPPLFIYIYIII